MSEIAAGIQKLVFGIFECEMLCRRRETENTESHGLCRAEKTRRQQQNIMREEKLQYDLNRLEAIPETEPERQQYFIEKCREVLCEKETELGRPLRFCVTTFGCPMV